MNSWQTFPQQRNYTFFRFYLQIFVKMWVVFTSIWPPIFHTSIPLRFGVVLWQSVKTFKDYEFSWHCGLFKIPACVLLLPLILVTQLFKLNWFALNPCGNADPEHFTQAIHVPASPVLTDLSALFMTFYNQSGIPIGFQSALIWLPLSNYRATACQIGDVHWSRHSVKSEPSEWLSLTDSGGKKKKK